MIYKRIAMPKWVEKGMRDEGMLDDIEYNKRNIKIYYTPEGKDFPLIQVNITYFLHETTPGMGHSVGFSTSVKFNRKDWWEQCSLPWNVFEDVLKIKDEILKIKPQIE